MMLRFGPGAFLVVLLAIAGACVLQSQQATPHANGAQVDTKLPASEDLPDSQRVEAGEYRVLSEDGIGPFVPAVFDFTESWTLWKLKDGSFQEKGERNYRSPSTEAHKESFSTHLSSDFHVLNIKYFGLLRWRPGSGPITCDFLPSELSCVSSAQDRNNRVNLDLPMHRAYGFLWPISALSLAGITRSAAHDRRKATAVELVQVDEASASDPVAATVLDGHLKYLGEEAITVAHREWTADKFELQVPLHPPLVLWISQQGLLLAAGTPGKGKAQTPSGLVLTEFQEWVAP